MSLRDPEIPSANVDLERGVKPSFLKPLFCLRNAGRAETIDISDVCNMEMECVSLKV